MDRDGIYRCVAEQEELCRQIQATWPAIDALQKVCAEQFGTGRLNTLRRPENAAWAGRLGSVQKGMEEAQAEVGRLNQIHGSFLRRSSRTIQALMNSLGNYALTYARPEQALFANGLGTESQDRG